MRRVLRVAVEVAAELYPNDYRRLVPRFFTAATWVGFDLDGRTDIGWNRSLSCRYQLALAGLEELHGSLRDLRERHAEATPAIAEAFDAIARSSRRVDRVLRDRRRGARARDRRHRAARQAQSARSREARAEAGRDRCDRRLARCAARVGAERESVPRRARLPRRMVRPRARPRAAALSSELGAAAQRDSARHRARRGAGREPVSAAFPRRRSRACSTT